MLLLFVAANLNTSLKFKYVHWLAAAISVLTLKSRIYNGRERNRDGRRRRREHIQVAIRRQRIQNCRKGLKDGRQINLSHKSNARKQNDKHHSNNMVLNNRSLYARTKARNVWRRDVLVTHKCALLVTQEKSLEPSPYCVPFF